VQALPTDADRSGDGTHPNCCPAPVKHHVAGGVEGEFTEAGSAESSSLGFQIGDCHGTELNRDGHYEGYVNAA